MIKTTSPLTEIGFNDDYSSAEILCLNEMRNEDAWSLMILVGSSIDN